MEVSDKSPDCQDDESSSRESQDEISEDAFGVASTKKDSSDADNENHISSVKSDSETSDEEIVKTVPSPNCTTEEKHTLEEELKEWAIPVANLFQYKSHNFIAEQNFNISISEFEPYCAVCSIFKPFQTAPEEIFGTSKKKIKEIPLQSVPWMPEVGFAHGADIGQIAAGNTLIDDNGKSKLIRCDDCKICVHASCYGAKDYEIGKIWKCSRCKKNQISAECCLCSLRGGALKPTTDNQWVHIVCAILIPEVVFQDILLREPVIVKRILYARIKLKCMYCYKLMLRYGSTRGACIQCFSGKCTLPFHVTCGYIAGLRFETCDGPSHFYVSCSRHTNKKANNKKRTLSEVQIGDFVVAKHRNNRYYRSEVVELSSQINYEIEFEDGTFSDNRVPADIENRDCEKFGPPIPEESVRVRWIDGVIYNGTFKREVNHKMLTVEFEDGARILTKREDVYSEDEELPKRVLSRMSEATEMKHEFSTDTISSKRQRVANLKYMSDGIILL